MQAMIRFRIPISSERAEIEVTFRGVRFRTIDRRRADDRLRTSGSAARDPVRRRTGPLGAFGRCHAIPAARNEFARPPRPMSHYIRTT